MQHKANVYNILHKWGSMTAITLPVRCFAGHAIGAGFVRTRRELSQRLVSFRYTLRMLFMVIERFKSGDANAVGECFKTSGRMLPAGVTYESSWMEIAGAKCFQIMEAPSREALNEWTERWSDLVDFEIVSVLPSAQFWARETKG